jgi:hypothetical protein
LIIFGTARVALGVPFPALVGWSSFFLLINNLMIIFNNITNFIIIRFGTWMWGGRSCWSKIPHGSPIISRIKVNFHQDFVASMYSNFFLGQMDRELILLA